MDNMNLSLSYYKSNTSITTEIITINMPLESNKLIKLTTLSTETSNIAKINTFLKRLNLIDEKNLEKILIRYTDKETLNFLKKVRSISIRDIVALLIWIESMYGAYGKPNLSLVFDPEEKEFQFFRITLRECNWNTWQKIAREIKEEMRKSNLEKLVSKIAIVCLKGLLNPI